MCRQKREREKAARETSSSAAAITIRVYNAQWNCYFKVGARARGFLSLSSLFSFYLFSFARADGWRSSSLFVSRKEEETKNSRTHPYLLRIIQWGTLLMYWKPLKECAKSAFFVKLENSLCYLRIKNAQSREEFSFSLSLSSRLCVQLTFFPRALLLIYNTEEHEDRRGWQ